MALGHVLWRRNDVCDFNDCMYAASRTLAPKDGLLCLASPVSFHGSVVDVQVTKLALVLPAAAILTTFPRYA